MAAGIHHIRVALVDTPTSVITRARVESAIDGLKVTHQHGEVIADISAERISEDGVFRYETPDGTYLASAMKGCSCGGTKIEDKP